MKMHIKTSPPPAPRPPAAQTAAPSSPPSSAPMDAPRAARLDDVPGIYNLLKHFSDREILLPRSEHDLYQNLREFSVVTAANKIIACGALQIFTDELGEVRSLAVDPAVGGRGLGTKLVNLLEAESVQLGLTRLMALTLSAEFFHRLGFSTVAMNTLPEKVWGACINCQKFLKCNEIAVLKHLR